MVANAEIAERKTVILLLVIAKMAAMKKVLSPNSETRMTLNASTNPCKNPWCSVPLLNPIKNERGE